MENQSYDPSGYGNGNNFDPNAGLGQPPAYGQNAFVPPAAGYDPNAYGQAAPAASYDPNAYGQPVDPNGQPAYYYTVTDLTGQTLYLNDAIVLGRRPDPAVSGYPQAQIMTIPSPAKQISRTHCLLVLNNGVAYVADLNSVNGTKLLRAQQSWPVEPGTSVPLENGDIIDLGEGQYLTISLVPTGGW